MAGRAEILGRWILPIAGSALALVLLFWLYGDLDAGAFLDALAGASPAWISVLATTILLEQLVRGWKWRQILYDLKPVSSLRLFGAVLAGYGAAILIPLGISPLVRSWLVARLEGLRMLSVLVTAAIERFIDGVVFALIAGLVALTGRIPDIEGDLRSGLAVAGLLGFALFASALWFLVLGSDTLGRDDSRASRAVDWIADHAGARFAGLRAAVRAGIVWPREYRRQLGVVVASIAMKAISASHFLWSGLAVGVLLAVTDYLFLMVFAGFSLVLARFIRIPGGFIIGSGFALKLLGVPDEKALAMILFSSVLTIVLMVGPGLLFLWRSGFDIRRAPVTSEIDGRD